MKGTEVAEGLRVMKANRLEQTQKGAAVTELILSIFRAHGRIMRGGDALLRDLGLSASRWQVLGAIKLTPKTVAQIAREFEVSRQGVLWNVQGLEKDNIVKLLKNPDHRRAKLVTMTDVGRKLYDEIERRQLALSNQIASSFRLGELRLATECVCRLGEIMRGDDIEEDEQGS
jgi:DNA-binding MarR family transcriptional regulator